MSKRNIKKNRTQFTWLNKTFSAVVLLSALTGLYFAVMWSINTLFNDSISIVEESLECTVETWEHEISSVTDRTIVIYSTDCDALYSHKSFDVESNEYVRIIEGLDNYSTVQVNITEMNGKKVFSNIKFMNPIE